MSSLNRIARFLSPWIALGLAAALVAVYLRPSLLPAPHGQAPVPVPATPAAVPAQTAAPIAAAPLPTRPPAAASYADAVARGAPAVVNISSRRIVVERRVPQIFEWFNGLPPFQRREESSRGSGVILDADGRIATNFHVVKGMQEIVVQLADGRTAAAKLVGTDPDTDLAILKIDLKNLPVMALGRSDRLRVGDVVLAIGNNAGLGQTVTQGIVSATGREIGAALLEDFIQTDAAINPGNSGGALISASGELVGINTAIVGREQGLEGIGFAIPVNLVRGVAAEITSKGHVVRGWSGLIVTSLPPELVDDSGAPVHGVQIRGVFRGSPAIGTGLDGGDVITELDGTAVRNDAEFLAAIARKAPGSTVRLKVIRPGERRFDVNLPIVARPLER